MNDSFVIYESSGGCTTCSHRCTRFHVWRRNTSSRSDMWMGTHATRAEAEAHVRELEAGANNIIATT